MEHLTRDTELQARLRRGINHKWTVIHHFFFDFDVSKDLRNNFEGFIRSLLYQLTKDLKAADLRGVKPEHGWSLRTLEQRLTIIIKQRSNPIFIFLDGLDEYQGDKWELASFLRETASSGVKLCLASRPHQVFNSTFEQIPAIKMQEWNLHAIDKMVTLRIQRDMATSGFYERKEIVELAHGISKMAQGVFLWARFAIEELRDGWSEGLDLEHLQRRLENVPEELEDIYARIFKKLRPEQRQQAAYMLQLVCHAKRTLTLRELYVATAHAASRQPPPVQQIRTRDMDDFEKEIFAVTGGVLEVFRTREAYRSQEFDDFDMRKNRGDEMMFVNVIHKTVRTYLENENSKGSSGWCQILGTAHEGSRHAQVLWLRVCTAIFPPSFKELPRVNPFSPQSSDAQLLLSTNLGNDKPLDVIEELSPLLEYASLYMLHHAGDVEQGLGLSTYTNLQPGISNSFLHFHRLYWRYRDRGCVCFLECPAPSHPVHLAIAHGLEFYVRDFLSVTYKDNGPRSRKWDEMLYIEPDCNDWYGIWKPPDFFRISLLEFAVHASRRSDNSVSQTRIVALLLKQYSHTHDAEMSAALQFASAEVVKLLLQDWPDGKMVLKPSPWISDALHQDLSGGGLSELCLDVFNCGSMWYIARRRYTRFEHDHAELIDLLVRRGEDINDQCGPVGTALHGALLRLTMGPWDYRMGSLLLANGANVNASGPLGTPLELVWQMVNTAHDLRSVDKYVDAMRWLIERGAVNNRCDPNGSIPSRERMLSIGAGGTEGIRKSQALYRGDPIKDID